MKCPTSFFHFSFGHALWKKTSKPKIKAEMFNGWEDVEEIIKACSMFLKSSKLSWLADITIRALWHQDDAKTHCARLLFAIFALEYVPGTLVSRQFENSLSRNTMHLQLLLPISSYCKKNSDGFAHVYQLEKYQLWFDPCCHWPAYMSYDLGKIAYIYRLKGQESLLGWDCLCPQLKVY